MDDGPTLIHLHPIQLLHWFDKGSNNFSLAPSLQSGHSIVLRLILAPFGLPRFFTDLPFGLEAVAFLVESFLVFSSFLSAAFRAASLAEISLYVAVVRST